MSYQQFLRSKQMVVPPSGIEVAPEAINPMLFPFQRDLVCWALRKGRAAIFADTGLGKTFMQLEWARLTAERALILAPLAVVKQTVEEGERWGIAVQPARTQADAAEQGITITNYEMLPHFDPDYFRAVVLDESSILKSFQGKTRNSLIKAFQRTPMRLCCTATPAPNDISEIANHAEFLGIMTRSEMLAAFFVHDDEGWRLKGHARQPFWRWLASWGMSIKRPSNLGYDDAGYHLPPLHIVPSIVQSGYVPKGQLFNTGIKGVTDRAAVRKVTIGQRVAAAAEMIQSDRHQWIAWVGLNDEGRLLAQQIPGAELVEGSQSPEEKTAHLARFLSGESRVIISKPSIFGFGLNLQRCARMVFVGLGDSYEQYYQCIRRCWRFGQRAPVYAHIVLTDAEEPIYQNVIRKEREAQAMSDEVIANVAEYEKQEVKSASLGGFKYRTDEASGKGWRLLLGDSAERLREIPDNSIGLSVFSPPFATLYTYSNSERDLGNCKTGTEFWQHFDFISSELLRVTRPGRHICVHVAQVPLQLAKDGVIGLSDFRGDTIKHFTEAGFIYHGEVCIDKDPQAQAIRTKSKALLFVQMRKDSSWSRPALADYILVFRKPGENAEPVHPDISNDEWIEWARPIWYGIRETETLNVAEARSEEDERHICPLQLGTIERCIRLWSNKGDTVLSPFAGIGSEGYQAIKLDRKFIGCELKPEYWQVAVKNLREAERQHNAMDLFSYAEMAGGS